jgi:K+-transporting ATPase ATPase C chain
MKTSTPHPLRPAITLFLLLGVLLGGLYPAGDRLAQAFFPQQANGSLIERQGQVVGSELIGQNFTSPAYFWGRPSAPARLQQWHGLRRQQPGPTNPALKQAAEDRAKACRKPTPTTRGDSHRPADGLGQRPGPAHQPGRRRTRPGAWPVRAA